MPGGDNAVHDEISHYASAMVDVDLDDGVGGERLGRGELRPPRPHGCDHLGPAPPFAGFGRSWHPEGPLYGLLRVRCCATAGTGDSRTQP